MHDAAEKRIDQLPGPQREKAEIRLHAAPACVLLRIITINVNGLREHGKFLTFEQFAAQEKPDVLVATETHLTAREARRLVITGYKVPTGHSQPKDSGQMKGGVAILVRIGISSEELKGGDVPQLELPLYSCSIIVYLQYEDQRAMQITGVYLPPKGGQTAALVGALTTPQVRRMLDGRALGHLLAGDFNHPSWTREYRLWTGPHGLWELSDPEVGTFRSGNSLDKFLFSLGGQVPMAVLPAGAPLVPLLSHQPTP